MVLSPQKLYAVLDADTCQRNSISLIDFTKAFFSGGGQNIQYRDKISSEKEIEKNINKLIKLSENYKNTKLIINDNSRLAHKYNLMVHLGQSDIKENNLLFGRSTHNIEEVEKAIQEEADYIGFGAMFNSPTKPTINTSYNILEQVLKIYHQPIVLIGGITIENIKQLPKSNNIHYAIISDFFRNGSKAIFIEQYTKNFLF